MTILNLSKNIVVASKVKAADTFFKRLLGLMFRKKPHPLLISLSKEGRISSSIHMFFVRFGLDVIWMDKGLRVVDLREEIKPFSLKIYLPKKKANYVLELPCEGIKGGKIEIGDQLQILEER